MKLKKKQYSAIAIVILTLSIATTLLTASNVTLAQTEKTHETRITTPEESSQSRHIRDLINQLPDPVPGAL